LPAAIRSVFTGIACVAALMPRFHADHR
jgi:hypothetical protein